MSPCMTFSENCIICEISFGIPCIPFSISFLLYRSYLLDDYTGTSPWLAFFFHCPMFYFSYSYLLLFHWNPAFACDLYPFDLPTHSVCLFSLDFSFPSYFHCFLPVHHLFLSLVSLFHCVHIEVYQASSLTTPYIFFINSVISFFSGYSLLPYAILYTSTFRE